MKIKFLIYLIFPLTIIGCQDDDQVYPKPISGMKLSFPNKEYTTMIKGCKYQFKTANYTQIDTSRDKCNINIKFLPFDAELFLTYIAVDSNLSNHIEYSRQLVYEHSQRADGINEKLIISKDNDVYGLAYNLIGNSASSYQFYITDSIKNFIRGALYFNVRPNYDSLKPTIEYLLPDFDTIFSTLEWQDE